MIADKIGGVNETRNIYPQVYVRFKKIGTETFLYHVDLYFNPCWCFYLKHPKGRWKYFRKDFVLHPNQNFRWI